MDNKVTLITGATGFVGSHLADKLIESGHEVRILTRKNSNLKWLNGKKVKIFDCGFYDFEGLKEALKDCNYVYHVGGVIKSKTVEGYYEGNKTVTRNLLDAVKKYVPELKRFIFVSSQAAAGPSLSKVPINESVTCNPITNYGKSKLAAEREVLSEINNIPVTIVRPPVVYGPRDPEVLLFFKTIKGGIQPTVGFKDKYVSIIYVDDLVDGIILAGNSEKSLNQIYFISSDNIYSWNELGSLAAKILNKKVLRLKIPHSIIFLVAGISQFLSYFKKDATILNLEKANEMIQSYWTCSNHKAKTELNFQPKIDLETGFRRTIDWYKEYGWL